MKVSKRLALSAAAIATVGIAAPSFAASHNSGGGTKACGNGNVTWDPSTLWAPNHKMQTINIAYTAGSNAPGDQSRVTVGAIVDDQSAQDGSDELKGSGSPKEGLDWAGTGNTGTAPKGSPAQTTAQVRAERSGTDPSGRTYTITVTCDDEQTTTDGGPTATVSSSTVMIDVTVPHDQGNH